MNKFLTCEQTILVRHSSEYKTSETSVIVSYPDECRTKKYFQYAETVQKHLFKFKKLRGTISTEFHGY